MKAKLSQIENATLSQYLKYTPSDRRVDEKHGKKDGKSNIPDTTHTVYPFLVTVSTDAKAALRNYKAKLEEVITDSKHRIETLQEDISERYDSQRKSSQNNYQNQINSIGKETGPQSVVFSHTEEKLTEYKDRVKLIEAVVGRPLRTHLSVVYGLIIGSVAVVELPINRFAFELYFSETPIISFFIALFIGICLAFLAHFCGLWIKRSTGASTRTQKWRYRIGAFFTFLLIAPTLYLIALLRQHYVHFIESQQVTFAELLQQEGVGQLAQDVISTQMGTQGWMLFFINIVIVSIGTICSVVRHDSHPDYESTIHVAEKLEKKLQKLKTKYESKFAELTRIHEVNLEKLDRQRDQLEREIQDSEQNIEKCHEHKNGIVKRLATHVLQQTQAYEKGNQESRTTEAPSMFWNTDQSAIEKELNVVWEER